MTPFWQDDHLTLYGGDCRTVLAEMPAESVHCVVTSPPYWGLRDYGTATWDGGDPACDHKETVARHDGGRSGVDGFHGSTRADSDKGAMNYRDSCGKCGAHRIDSQLGLEPTPEEYVANMVAVFREVRRVLRADGTLWLNLGDSYAGSGKGGNPEGSPWSGFVGSSGRETAAKAAPPIVPAGLKPKDLVGIPWRVAFALQADGWVLRSDVVWSKPNPMPESVTDRPTKAHEMLFLFAKGKRIGPEPTRYDDIPEGEARWLAALFDGEGSLVCRRESPVGENYGAHAAQVSIGGTSRALIERLAAVIGEGSVLERKGMNAPMHYWQTSGKRALGLLRRIYPFLVVKQRQARCLIALEEGKRYPGGHARIALSEVARRERIWHAVKSLNHFGDPDLSGIPEPVFGRWTSQPYYFDADAVREPHISDGRGGFSNKNTLKAVRLGASHAPSLVDAEVNPAGRNLRSVWTIATEPYPGAHFATFPRKLVEPCVKAGTSERGVCPECGAPWVRVVERGEAQPEPMHRHPTKRLEPGQSGHPDEGNMGFRASKLSGQEMARWKAEHPDTTTGWRASCAHDATPVPAQVLDLFAGSGTSLLVAQSLGRRGVGIDLNPEYLRQALERNRQTPLGLVG